MIALRLEAHDPDVRVLGCPVCDGRTADAGNHAPHARIIDADHGKAVEREVVHEVDEGILQLVIGLVIGAHVVAVDVGDDGDGRLQVEEGGVALVSLGDEEVALAETGVRAPRVEAPADDVGRIAACHREDARDEGGRGGLPVGARNRDAVTEAHELSEHLGALHDRNALLLRLDVLGIGLPDGGGDHDDARAGDVLRLVPYRDFHPEAPEVLDGSVLGEIGSGYLISLVRKHLGYAAHSGAADADKMNSLDPAHSGDMVSVHQFSPRCTPRSARLTARRRLLRREARPRRGRCRQSAPQSAGRHSSGATQPWLKDGRTRLYHV